MRQVPGSVMRHCNRLPNLDLCALEKRTSSSRAFSEPPPGSILTPVADPYSSFPYSSSPPYYSFPYSFSPYSSSPGWGPARTFVILDWCSAISETTIPVFNLRSTHSFITKGLIYLFNCLWLRITEFQNLMQILCWTRSVILTGSRRMRRTLNTRVTITVA